MVSDEELIQKVEESSAHPDVTEYIRVAIEKDKGMGLVSSLRHFAENSSVEDLGDIGSPLEQEIWTNGVRRLANDPHGEPYAASPDEDTLEVIKEVENRL